MQNRAYAGYGKYSPRGTGPATGRPGKVSFVSLLRDDKFRLKTYLWRLAFLCKLLPLQGDSGHS